MIEHALMVIGSFIAGWMLKGGIDEKHKIEKFLLRCDSLECPLRTIKMEK